MAKLSAQPALVFSSLAPHRRESGDIRFALARPPQATLERALCNRDQISYCETKKHQSGD